MENDQTAERPESQRPEGQEATDSSELRICYLTCPKDASNSFLGAIMLTDARARPLYFSYVTPVRPTSMQRILYGMTLEEHVRVDVIANGLLKPVPERPDVLFVDELSLVAVRKVAGIPTAFLKKADDSAAVEQKLTTLMYDTGGNTADQEFIGQVLAKLETQCDLVEPFARMREALKEVIKNAGK